MAFVGSILRLLLSAPSDVPEEDRRTIFDTVNGWNVREGETHGVAVVPMHWAAHAAAQYGIRPQESINQQLVDRSDVVLAIFWHRLGMPTGEADSGTVEELERAAVEGKYVAVLKCERPTNLDEVDAEQLQRLREFLDRNRQQGLIKSYADQAALAREVEQILFVAAGRAQVSAGSPGAATPRRTAEVWASALRQERQRTDGKGQLKISQHDQLVLENRGDLPAYRVTFELEPTPDGQPPMLVDGESNIEVLPPGTPYGLPVYLHGGSAASARCRVHWSDTPDDDGVLREQISSVRFS